jgi:predicted AlkP superfamily pyrophosphatase or phosphodiesterase
VRGTPIMTDHRGDPTTLERLFARRLLSRRQFVAGLAALGMAPSAISSLVGASTETAFAAAPPAGARYLVLIVLDAFRPDYLPLAAMPTVSALARSGVSYDSAWVGQLESYSPTGHASISTGCLPKHTGVLGFEWRDPATQKEALDGWPTGVLAGDLERDLRESGVDSIALALKASDPSATIVAISSEKVYAADAIGGWAADYILHHQKDQQGTMLLPSAVPGHIPPASFLARPELQFRLPLRHFTDWDYLSTVLALAAIEEFRPRALLVNLPGADYYGHPYGGPASPAVFSQVATGIENNISRIVRAYKKAGIYEQTLFVVTADHGMVPNTRNVDGALTKQIVQQAGGEYYFHTGGTCAYIYLHNQKKGKAVAQAFIKAPNVTGSYYLVDAKQTYYYDLAPGMKIDPALNTAYHALLSTFVGPRAPDVVVTFRENTIGRKLAAAHGDHGGLNWGSQHIPLILSGPGITPGVTSHFPARLIDLAPTALRVLGLQNRAMDGIVLADALNDATAQEIAIQQGQMGTLTANQAALVRQSSDNVAEDKALRLAPPAGLPPKP